MELTNEGLRKERVLQVAEVLDDWRTSDEQNYEYLLKDFLVSLQYFCADKGISLSDCLRVSSGLFAQDLVEQLPKKIERNGYEYILTTQALNGRWQAGYRWQLVTLPGMVGEGDTLYLALERLKDKLAEESV